MSSPEDLDDAVELVVATLGDAVSDDWDVPAGSLEWTCWETAEHLADDLFAYAAQLGPRRPPRGGHVPFVFAAQRPDGPRNVIFAKRDADASGLLQVIEACGALLVAMVRTTPASVRAYHVFGESDPAGFAAMGIVETLVHGHDIAEGLGVDLVPPARLCDRVLTRLFPDAPAGEDRWRTLLWATGRAELPDRPLLTEWRWDSTP